MSRSLLSHYLWGPEVVSKAAPPAPVLGPASLLLPSWHPPGTPQALWYLAYHTLQLGLAGHEPP